MNSLPEILHTISYLALPLMLAIVLHEYAHGWVADRFGDSTARLQGRLTTNPLAHIDPFGTILFPLICLLLPGGFFWRGPNRCRSILRSCGIHAVTWRSSRRRDPA